MKLEAGKYYKTRDGQTVGPLVLDDMLDTWPYVLPDWSQHPGICTGWMESGSWWSDARPNDLDLVAEADPVGIAESVRHCQDIIHNWATAYTPEPDSPCLPADDEERKKIDLTLQWKLFPLATRALSEHIQAGGDKWCGGEPKWNREKSPNEIQSLLRHLFEAVVSKPTKYMLSAIVWRAMAMLEKFLEKEESC